MCGLNAGKGIELELPKFTMGVHAHVHVVIRNTREVFNDKGTVHLVNETPDEDIRNDTILYFVFHMRKFLRCRRLIRGITGCCKEHGRRDKTGWLGCDVHHLPRLLSASFLQPSTHATLSPIEFRIFRVS